MRLSAQGATGWAEERASGSASAVLIAAIHSSSVAAVRQLGAGNAPTIPARQAAITSSGPETRNIGAANTGIRNRRGRAEPTAAFVRAETSSITVSYAATTFLRVVIAAFVGA